MLKDHHCLRINHCIQILGKPRQTTCYVPQTTVSSFSGGDPLRKRQPTSCQAAPRPWRFFPISTILIPHRSFPHSAPAVLPSSASQVMCCMVAGQRVTDLRLRCRPTCYRSWQPALPSLRPLCPSAITNGWWIKRISLLSLQPA